MKLQEIAQDVFACLQPDRGLGWSNSGFINSGGGLVIDTFWDLRSTRELIENYSRGWREFREEPFDAPIDAVAIFRGMYELRVHQRLR